MRAVINISLPAPMVKIVKDEVVGGGYASVSEFFRQLVRDWQEDKHLRELMQSEAEFKTGKFKVLKSLRDLR